MSLNPAVTQTAMDRGIPREPAKIVKILKRIPMNRSGQSDDIAKAMVFLASDEAGS